MSAAQGAVVIPYRPHPASTLKIGKPMDGRHPQEAFHRDRYHVPYRAALAGTGGGKTAAGAFELISWSLENPGSVALCCEPDFPMIRRVMLPSIVDLLGDLDHSPIVRSFNKSEMRIELRNGSVWWFISLEDPKKTEGPNVDAVWVDEARVVRRWADCWRSLKRRLRGSRPGNRVGAWITTHSPTQEQRDEFEGPHTDPKLHRVYRWSTLDNPLLPKQYLDEIVRSHSGAAYDAVVLGLFARPEGIVYTEFNPTQHVHPPPTRTDNVEWRVSYGVDWGWTQPSCISVVVWTGSRAHVVDEYYASHVSPDELVVEAKRLRDTWGNGVYHCGADRPENISRFNAAGLTAVAYTGKVTSGTSHINGMYRGSDLYVAPGCTNHLREMDLYSYPPDAPEGKRDEPAKGNDHAMDAKRYGVMGHLQVGGDVTDLDLSQYL